jgi:hypothetical protein
VIVALAIGVAAGQDSGTSASHHITRLSCALSVVSHDVNDDAHQFKDELVVEVAEDGKSLSSINGKGDALSFDFFNFGVALEPPRYENFLSGRDSWSVDSRTGGWKKDPIILEKININRFTGTLTYSREETAPEYSLRKITASGQCESMEGKPRKF